jgi:hypothetical protein
MLRARVTFLVVLIGTLSGGCRDGSTAPSDARSAIPLSVGSQWEYDVVDSLEIGVPERPAPVLPRLVVRVLRDTLIEGTRWSVVDNARALLDLLDGSLLLRSTNTGIVRWNELTFGFLPRESLSLPFPASTGTRVGGLEVTNADTTVIVPAGRFRAVRYDRFTADRRDSETMLVAPGVGVVARISSRATREGPVAFRQSRLAYRLARFTIASR